MIDSLWMQSLAEDDAAWHRLRRVGPNGMVTSCLLRMQGEIRVSIDGPSEPCPACKRDL